MRFSDELHLRRGIPFKGYTSAWRKGIVPVVLWRLLLETGFGNRVERLTADGLGTMLVWRFSWKNEEITITNDSPLSANVNPRGTIAFEETSSLDRKERRNDL